MTTKEKFEEVKELISVLCLLVRFVQQVGNISENPM